MDSVGQQRMAALHGGRKDQLEVSPNLWAGIGLVRGGAGTALVGDPKLLLHVFKNMLTWGLIPLFSLAIHIWKNRSALLN